MTRTTRQSASQATTFLLGSWIGTRRAVRSLRLQGLSWSNAASKPTALPRSRHRDGFGIDHRPDSGAPVGGGAPLLAATAGAESP